MPGCHPRAGGGGPRGGGLRGLRNANGGEKKPREACCATWARPPRPGRADSRQGDPSGEAGSRAGERPRLRGLVGVRRVAWAPAARLIPSQTSTHPTQSESTVRPARLILAHEAIRSRLDSSLGPDLCPCALTSTQPGSIRGKIPPPWPVPGSFRVKLRPTGLIGIQTPTPADSSRRRPNHVELNRAFSRFTQKG